MLDESLREDLPIFFNLLAVPDPERPLPVAAREALQRLPMLPSAPSFAPAASGGSR